jgi:hypothetical protein
MSADAAPVTIVSGLPRSGTSLMMQMLAAGGLPVLTDGARPADQDNPRGYYEFEPVKRTRQDTSWLAQAVGKAVKVVHLLLPDLPAAHHYRVLFLRRELRDVLASQRSMLRRLGNPGAALSPDDLEQTYRAQLRRVEQWLAQQDHFSVCDVHYEDLLRNPMPVVKGVRDFVGVPLVLEAMVRQIDPALWRHRAPEITRFN